MVGEISSRMPENICRGSVRCSGPPINRITITSSNDVTKAKSAPEMTPGSMSGSTTLKNTVCGAPPSEAPARMSVRSKLISVAVTVMTTKGVASAVWARMIPISVPLRPV